MIEIMTFVDNFVQVKSTMDTTYPMLDRAKIGIALMIAWLCK